MSDTMFLATRSFSAEYYGRSELIREGITRLAPGHEILAGYPDAFTPIEVGEGSPRTRDLCSAERTRMPECRVDVSTPPPFGSWGPPARSTPAAPASSHWSDVELREYGGSQIVRLTPTAKAQLERAALEHSDGRETGGALFAVRGDLDLVIAGATPPSPYDERGADFFVHDEEREARCITDDEHVVGSYHSHPISADGRPSQTDLGAWSLKRELLGLDAFIGAILTPATNADAFTGQPMGWLEPTIHMWVVREVGGALVAEPAGVEEKWGWE